MQTDRCKVQLARALAQQVQVQALRFSRQRGNY